MTVPLPMRDEESPGEWRFSLFGCFEDCGLCTTTICCPCVTYGRTKDKMNPESGFCLNCVVWCTVSHIVGPWFMGYRNRRVIRRMRNIPGTTCGDCCVHFCCPCCGLIQEAREFVWCSLLVMIWNSLIGESLIWFFIARISSSFAFCTYILIYIYIYFTRCNKSILVTVHSLVEFEHVKT